MRFPLIIGSLKFLFMYMVYQILYIDTPAKFLCQTWSCIVSLSAILTCPDHVGRELHHEKEVKDHTWSKVEYMRKKWEQVSQRIRSCTNLVHSSPKIHQRFTSLKRWKLLQDLIFATELPKIGFGPTLTSEFWLLWDGTIKYRQM